MKISTEVKRTSRKWAEIYGLTFKSFKGFPSQEYFNLILCSKDSFFDMAANCELDVNVNTGRRAASEFKNRLIRNNYYK